MRKGKAVIAFDFRGRPIGTYPSISECARKLNLSSSCVSKNLKRDKPVKKNGITFDETI